MRQIFVKRQSFRALLGAAVVLAAAGRSTASPYKITVLDGNVGWLYDVTGKSLNNFGQVAGTLYLPSGTWRPEGNYPYFYDPTANGRVTLLGVTSPSGQNPGVMGPQGRLFGLNDLGQAVGSTNNGAFLYDGTTGQVTNLPVPDGWITNSGQVIGSQEVARLGDQTNYHPYLYQNGTIQDLGIPPGAVGARAQAVNNAGEVLVLAAMTPGSFDHSFLLSGGKWTDLGAILATGINDKGTIVGNLVSNAGQTNHAALMSPGGSPVDFGTLPGDSWSFPYGINNKGQIVGLSFKQNSTDLYQGFLYQNGVMTNLNSLIAASSGWTIKEGLSINDLGQILALGDNGSSEHTLLLTPAGLPTPPDPILPELSVPEPSAIVVFGFLAMAFASRISHRPGRRDP